MGVRIISVSETGSTNSALASMAGITHGTVLTAGAQTAGRGQRGNTWEAEPGKNLTFSMLLRPTSISASNQFELSQIVSLAIVSVLDDALGVRTAIKWPNDIYAGDGKICGILIENTLIGMRIERSIVGIGLNVNQNVFLSDAPNPVSMAGVAGHEFDTGMLLEKITDKILDTFDTYETEPEPAELGALYFSRLWRNHGFYPYRDAATGMQFEAEIAGVSPSGVLTLREEDGRLHEYRFKEVAAIL